MKSRQEIKALAKEAMREQRGSAILLGFVFMLLLFIVLVVYYVVAYGPLIVSVIENPNAVIELNMGLLWGATLVFFAVMLIFMAMEVNLYGAYVKIFKREPASVGLLFSGLKVNFWRKVGGMLWMALFVFLWSLLFTIPGIIKGLAYFAAPYILATCPDVKAREALKLSMRITKGHKGKIFVLGLSFIGWMLLGSLTFGILTIGGLNPGEYRRLTPKEVKVLYNEYK